jgi:hypothetical protein
LGILAAATAGIITATMLRRGIEGCQVGQPCAVLDLAWRLLVACGTLPALANL